MKYYKTSDNEIRAIGEKGDIDGDQSHLVQSDWVELPKGEFVTADFQVKPYKLNDSYLIVERDNENNIIAPQSLVEQLQAEAAKKLITTYTQAMEAYMDAKAEEKGYDNRYTVSLRVNSPVEKFKLEGYAFMNWMDNCYALGYQILADVQNGTRPIPTVEEFLSELPELTW